MLHNPEVVLSPAELIRRRIESLNGEVAAERGVRRHFVKRDGEWVTLFHEEDGTETTKLADDPMIGLLTLAESVALRRNEGHDIDLEGFWLGVEKNKDLAAFRQRMLEDPILGFQIKALVEEIFDTPELERIDGPLYDELVAMFSSSAESHFEPRSSSTTSAPTLYDHVREGRRRNRRRVGGALIVFAAISTATAFRLLPSDDESESLAAVPTTDTIPAPSEAVPTTATAVESSAPDLSPTVVVSSAPVPSQPTTTVETTLAVPFADPAITTEPKQPQTEPPEITVAPTTTTQLPETTTPPTEAPAPTAPPRRNDSILSADACAALGGFGQSFTESSPTLWSFLKTTYNISDGQVQYLLTYTDIPSRFHIQDIYKSDATKTYSECMPGANVIQAALANYTGA